MLRSVSVLGVDGRPGGWIGAEVTGRTVRWHPVRRAAELLELPVDAVGIDIPIGLPERGTRACDRAARAELGPARSSVFWAPPRPALDATTHAEAVARCHAAGAPGMSIQAWHIVPKITEVDRWMTPHRQRRVVEVHPEVSFRRLGRDRRGAGRREHRRPRPADRDRRVTGPRTETGRTGPGYRWVVLGVGVVAQAAFAAVSIGLPAVAPALREHYGLSIPQLGVALAAVVTGMVVTMLGWGVLADRVGERKVMSAGLLGAAGAVLLASRVDGAVGLVAALALAGMFGASVNAASGRAVAGWFAPAERGLAMGIRQSALPVGGALAAATLPRVAGRADAPRALVVLAAVCAVGALVAAVGMRDPVPEAPQHGEPGPGTHPLRDGRIWRLAAVSFALVVPQLSLLSFVALYLHDERGLTPVAAGAVLAGMQITGAGARIVVGVVSDRRGSRLPPLRWIALGVAATLLVSLALLHAPVVLTAASLAVAGVLALSWNGLAFLAAAEAAPARNRGAALGLQNTVVALSAAVAPICFGLAVAAAGWTTAFALLLVAPAAALLLLGPLLHRPVAGTVPG